MPKTEVIGRGSGLTIAWVALWSMLGFMGVAVLLPGKAEAASQLKIGYVDAQEVLDKTKAGGEAKESMQAFVKSRQNIINLEETEIKKLQEELSRQAAVLSPEALREREDELQSKLMSYQKRAGDLTREVQEKNKEVLVKFHRKLENIVKKIAKREGYDYILDRNAEGGVLLYAKDSLDLTQTVIKELEKAFR